MIISCHSVFQWTVLIAGCGCVTTPSRVLCAAMEPRMVSVWSWFCPVCSGPCFHFHPVAQLHWTELQTKHNWWSANKRFSSVLLLLIVAYPPPPRARRISSIQLANRSDHGNKSGDVRVRHINHFCFSLTILCGWKVSEKFWDNMLLELALFRSISNAMGFRSKQSKFMVNSKRGTCNGIL